MNDSPIQLITTKPDAELAEDHKKAVIDAAKPLLDALTKMDKDGFLFQLGFGKSFTGNIVITNLILMRQF